MIETLPISVGLGLVVSLLLSELLGVASAGMVVPGYIALYMVSPLHLASTLSAAFLTYAIVRGLGAFVILYGRRRTAVAILVGYIAGALGGFFATRYGPEVVEGQDAVIGYIIPGLIAIWMDRQGVLETFGSLTICSVIVRLLLLIFVGQELPTGAIL